MLNVNSCTVNSFLTLIPLQQLKGPSQHNSKSVLASLSVIMLYSTGHTIEFVNQTSFW